MQDEQTRDWWDISNAENSGLSGAWDDGTYTDPNNQPQGGGSYPYDDQFAQTVTGWYQKYLGRTPSPAEIQSHWGNPGGLNAVWDVIRKSPEAEAWAAKQKADAGNAGGGGTNTGGTGGGSGGGGGSPTYDINDFGGEAKWWAEQMPGAWVPPTWEDMPGLVLPEWTTPGAFVAPEYVDLPTFTAPEFTKPGEFVAPTTESVTNDPAFQARLKMGTDAIQRSAAARGTLLNTGTVQGLNQYAQDYASNEYNAAYGRARDTYDANYAREMDAYKALYGSAWDQYQAAYNKAMGENTNKYNQALSTYNTNYQRQLDDYNARTDAAKTKYNADYGAKSDKYAADYNKSRDAYNAAMDQYRQRYNEWLTGDSNKFERLYRLAALGKYDGTY